MTAVGENEAFHPAICITQPGWGGSVYWDSFYHAQHYFTEECLGRNAPPLSTLDDAPAARLIVDAAIQPLETSAWVPPKL